ncbi:MmcQ/YjbR family DNA-binding protein [Pararhodobacter sp. SW119]|uniref:MmcQ/YjbR family DNA-binding protein n=1 Tax=Pararhodobacter sp. SW119 TaxID=2780075 RepID=UPI001ADFE966|nr:MmcQ/YjbR family DNA-binding protein [Pararhodobacter sp. SW119]
MGQSRETVRAICRALPGTEVSDPWGGGHDAWKVGGKLFAVIGTMDTCVAVKCADIDSAELLIDLGRAERAPYFHRSWVHLPWDRVDDAELRDRIVGSYQVIRDKLPKKVQAALAPAPTRPSPPATR